MGEESSREELYQEYLEWILHWEINNKDLLFIQKVEDEKFEKLLLHERNWLESKIKPLCDKLGFKYPWIPLTVEDWKLKSEWKINGP